MGGRLPDGRPASSYVVNLLEKIRCCISVAMCYQVGLMIPSIFIFNPIWGGGLET